MNRREEVSAVTRPSTDDDVAALFARRQAPVEDLAGQAGAVATTCHAMAVRFHQGGKLVVFGTGTESTDALHVAVEFVHPVIVGKRALPAISLTADVATVTGLAASGGIERHLRPPDRPAGRAGRHRAGHRGRRKQPQRAARPGGGQTRWAC